VTPASNMAESTAVILDTAEGTAPHASHACLPATTWSIALRWLLACLFLPHHPGNNPGSTLTRTLSTAPYRRSSKVLGFHASDNFPVFVLLSPWSTAPVRCGQHPAVLSSMPRGDRWPSKIGMWSFKSRWSPWLIQTEGDLNCDIWS